MDIRKETNEEPRKEAIANDGCHETTHDAVEINHSSRRKLTCGQDTRTSKTESSEDIGELTDCKEGYGPHEMNLGPLKPLDLDNLPKPDRTNAFPAGKYLVRFPMAVPPPKAYTTQDGRKIVRTPNASEIMATKKPLASYMDGDLVIYEGGLVTYLPSSNSNWIGEVMVPKGPIAFHLWNLAKALHECDEWAVFLDEWKNRDGTDLKSGYITVTDRSGNWSFAEARTAEESLTEADPDAWLWLLCCILECRARKNRDNSAGARNRVILPDSSFDIIEGSTGNLLKVTVRKGPSAGVNDEESCSECSESYSDDDHEEAQVEDNDAPQGKANDARITSNTIGRVSDLDNPFRIHVQTPEAALIEKEEYNEFLTELKKATTDNQYKNLMSKASGMTENEIAEETGRQRGKKITQQSVHDSLKSARKRALKVLDRIGDNYHANFYRLKNKRSSKK